jgi:MFS family permease
MLWHITLTTKSGVMMTVYIVCGFVPAFILSPFAGVWADRFDRKKLIMMADGMIALATLGLALVFMAGKDALWLMFLTAAIRSVGTALQQPAVGAFIPQIIPEDKLTRVNGINASMQAVIMLVSPMLSGTLLSLAPMQTIFFIDVVTAALAIGRKAGAILLCRHETRVHIHSGASLPALLFQLPCALPFFRHSSRFSYLSPSGKKLWLGRLAADYNGGRFLRGHDDRRWTNCGPGLF